MAVHRSSCCLQEKVLPFMSVSQAVAVPEEEPSPLDEVEEELRQLHLQRSAAVESAEKPTNSAAYSPANDLPGSTDAAQPHEEALDGSSPAQFAALKQGLVLCSITTETCLLWRCSVPVT